MSLRRLVMKAREEGFPLIKFFSSFEFTFNGLNTFCCFKVEQMEEISIVLMNVV